MVLGAVGVKLSEIFMASLTHKQWDLDLCVGIYRTVMRHHRLGAPDYYQSLLTMGHLMVLS